MKMMFDTIQAILEEMRIIRKNLNTLTNSPEDDVKEIWVDAQIVKEKLFISDRTLQRYRDSGTLGFSKLKGRTYYKLSDIEALLQQNYTPKQDQNRRDGKQSGDPSQNA